MANNPELLTRPLAEDGDKATIPDTTDGSTGIFSQQYGFQSINSLPLQAGGKAVRREDFNGAFNLLGGIAYYAQKGFTFNFDATQDYFTGCVVIDTTDGKRYECIADVAAGGSVPSADATHWKPYGEVDISGKANVSLNNLDAAGQAILDGKADVSLSNLSTLSATAKSTLSHLAMPDYSAGVDITGYRASSNQFTAPTDGIVYFALAGSGAVYINGNELVKWGTGSGDHQQPTVFLRAGDKIYCTCPVNYNDGYNGHFFPLMGQV